MSTAHEMIVKAKVFQPSTVTYKPATVDSRGGKKVSLQLNGQQLVIAAPLMFTWGVNERVDETTGRVSYDMSLVFEKEKSNSVLRFWQKMEELQQKVLTDAVARSKEWFGKSKLSTEVAEAMMYPILRYPKDKQTGDPDLSRNPNMKCKLQFWDGAFKCELFDMHDRAIFLPPKGDRVCPQGDKTPVDLVPSRSYVKPLIACTGLWMAGGRFGVTWKLVQANVRPPVQLIGQGICHLQPDSDDEEMLSAVKHQEGAGSKSHSDDDHSGSAPHFSDGSDEDEVEESAVASPPPAPKKKKKVVRRKKKPSASTGAY